MKFYGIIYLLLGVTCALILTACQSDGLILERKNMHFVGQFNKGFDYDILGFGPVLKELRFTEGELLDLAREQVPELDQVEEIHLVDVGFNVRPGEGHEAQFIDIQILADSADQDFIFSLEDLLIDSTLALDPAQLGLGESYPEMLENLNALMRGDSINEYILDLLFLPEDDGMMQELELDVIFSLKFSFRACVDVPAGTEARECAE